MVASFAIELVEFLEIELLQQTVVALHPDQIIETAGIGQSFFERLHRGTILNLADLLREVLRVLSVEAKQDILDRFDLPGYLFGGLEKIGIVFKLIAKFGLQLFEIGFVGGIELFANIGEINDVAVTKILVGTIDPSQGLKQVMFTDQPAHIEFFQPFGIKTGEEHIVDEQKVDFSGFELLHPSLAILLAAFIVQNQGATFHLVCLALLACVKERGASDHRQLFK